MTLDDIVTLNDMFMLYVNLEDNVTLNDIYVIHYTRGEYDLE